MIQMRRYALTALQHKMAPFSSLGYNCIPEPLFVGAGCLGSELWNPES